ncbi:hypothetical protein SAMN02745671_01173 [Anaerovibrio lipolyticus DSM 3074]|uniref:Phage neck terminator protein gp12-like domain-containing protein n=1 Tax=Anaerovibrio lipolyticus DSM 3074 TaxID=1120997 RepID=A0A1M6CLT7_9FIRM|nr:hypothetical protein SAMN02745671_01173 [Anaerovibrio lipolyticus DSM 3074]
MIWANQNLPKLKRPFATLWLYGSREEAYTESRPSANPQDLNRILVTPTEAVLEVQLFGEKGTFPYDDLEHLVGRLAVDSVVNKCYLAGVSFFDSEAVQDISGLLDDRQTYECRAAVDLHVRFMKVIADDNTIIEQVEGITIPASGNGDGTGGDNIDGVVTVGQLIYGKIGEDGTIEDGGYSIPVNISTEFKGT